MHILKPQEKRFLIGSTIPQNTTDEQAFEDIKECKELIETYGGKVVEYITQSRDKSDKGPYLGKGKIEEIAQLVLDEKIDIVVLNAIIRPGQTFDIKKMLLKSNPDIQVWDRVDLILQIFSKHASTTESKLQIELAGMRHMGPRIYGMGYVLSRQGGTVGTRGIGETNTELMKRHWRDQMKKTQERILKLTTERKNSMENRSRNGVKTVSIVGYTNAGKTSLFNHLTKKNQLVQDALFATLDSHVGKLYLKNAEKQIVVSDTIGFIKNLPPSLIDSFRSTLLESIHADVLIHVLDASDHMIVDKYEAVKDILKELNINSKKQILVLNKIDLLDKNQLDSILEKFSPNNPILISVKNSIGISDMTERIETELFTQSSTTDADEKQLVAAYGLITRDKHFLIVKRAAHDTHPNIWELPGGAVEKNETLRDAVIREVHEESGLHCTPIEQLKRTETKSSSRPESTTQRNAYHCTMNNDRQKVKLSSEHSEYKWVTRNDLSNLSISDFLIEVLEAIKDRTLIT